MKLPFYGYTDDIQQSKSKSILFLTYCFIQIITELVNTKFIIDLAKFLKSNPV